jgi:hypothetical protein
MAAMAARATSSQERRIGLPRRTTLTTSQPLPRRVVMMALLAILPPAGLVAVAGAPDVWAVAADMPNSGGALTGLEAQRKRLAQEHRELTNRI